MTKHNTPSRERPPWTGKDDATPLQSFIDTSNVTNYEKKHPLISDTEESTMLNAYSLDICRYYNSQRIKNTGSQETMSDDTNGWIAEKHSQWQLERFSTTTRFL